MNLNVNEDFIKKYGEELKNQGDEALKNNEEAIKAVENSNLEPYDENAFRDFVDRTVQRYRERREEKEEEEKGRHR